LGGFCLGGLDALGLDPLLAAFAAATTPTPTPAATSLAIVSAGFAFLCFFGFLGSVLGLELFERGGIDPHVGSGPLFAVLGHARLTALDGIMRRPHMVVRDQRDREAVLFLEGIERAALHVEHVERDVGRDPHV